MDPGGNDGGNPELAELVSSLRHASPEDLAKLYRALELLFTAVTHRPVPATAPRALDSRDAHGVAQAILSGRARKVVVMCGAGISVSAGIPDFRSPGTGLYSRLAACPDLPYPEAVFDIGYFRENPRPFFELAKELFPSRFNPTPAHRFIKRLCDQGVLLRCFTQNIDTLEAVVGIPNEKLVFAHGSFSSAHCVSCGREHDFEFLKVSVLAGEVPRCKGCAVGVVKPDIVFFGESLPARFHERAGPDLAECDLLIVMGTSLQVMPFASLVDRTRPSVPRVLVNNVPLPGTSLNFGPTGSDVLLLGTCDQTCQLLADELGYGPL